VEQANLAGNQVGVLPEAEDNEPLEDELGIRHLASPHGEARRGRSMTAWGGGEKVACHAMGRKGARSDPG
jgi:hypothetical protein